MLWWYTKRWWIYLLAGSNSCTCWSNYNAIKRSRVRPRKGNSIISSLWVIGFVFISDWNVWAWSVYVRGCLCVRAWLVIKNVNTLRINLNSMLWKTILSRFDVICSGLYSTLSISRFWLVGRFSSIDWKVPSSNPSSDGDTVSDVLKPELVSFMLRYGFCFTWTVRWCGFMGWIKWKCCRVCN